MTDNIISVNPQNKSFDKNTEEVDIDSIEWRDYNKNFCPQSGQDHSYEIIAGSGNYMLYETQYDDTADEILEKVKKLTEDDWLWTGESVYCICTHHVAQHCTIYNKRGSVADIYCHGDNELCSCEHFRTQMRRGSTN